MEIWLEILVLKQQLMFTRELYKKNIPVETLSMPYKPTLRQILEFQQIGWNLTSSATTGYGREQ